MDANAAWWHLKSPERGKRRKWQGENGQDAGKMLAAGRGEDEHGFRKEIANQDGEQYTTLHFTTLHYTIPRYSTQHYSTLQYTTLITPHHNYNCNCNYTTLITLNYNYNLQLQLHYTTTTTALHHTTPNSCGEVTTATIATTPENTTPTTFRSISGFALPSVSHNNQFLKLPPPPCTVLLVQ